MKQTKLKLTVELACEMGVDFLAPEERDWFLNDVLGADPHGLGCLVLHSNEIGDTIGTVRVLEIVEATEGDE